MAYQTVTVERAHQVATLTLNRPDAYNALNVTLGRELFAAVLELDEDPDVRCIVMTGSGQAPSARAATSRTSSTNLRPHRRPHQGADDVSARRHLAALPHRQARHRGRQRRRGRRRHEPGPVGRSRARHRVGEVHDGLLEDRRQPDGSSSYFLPRLIGLRRSMELYFTNRTLSRARGAWSGGSITRVVPDAEFKTAVDALARELAQGPTKAFGVAKRLFHQSTWESLETQMELEAQAHRRLRAAPRTSAPASPRSPRRSRPRRSADAEPRARILTMGGSHEAAPLLPPWLIVLRQDEGAPLVLGDRVRSRRRPGRSRGRRRPEALRGAARARRLRGRPRRARLESGRLRGTARRALHRERRSLTPRALARRLDRILEAAQAAGRTHRRRASST